MHPLVHSPTQTTLKSKWNTFKEWFTPDLAKRRPSQCSTTSTNTTSTTSTTNTSNCCCNNKEENLLFIASHIKRPSLTNSLNEGGGGVLDKCMSPFRRRPSNASCCSSAAAAENLLETNSMEKEIEKLYELYNLAMDEINYAEDSRGSPYYSGDRIAAKEAIENCTQSYEVLLEQYNQQEDFAYLSSTIGYKISTLITKFDALPLQDDQLSF